MARTGVAYAHHSNGDSNRRTGSAAFRRYSSCARDAASTSRELSQDAGKSRCSPTTPSRLTASPRDRRRASINESASVLGRSLALPFEPQTVATVGALIVARCHTALQQS